MKAYNRTGEAQGFNFSFGVRRSTNEPQAFIEIDDAYDARISIEASDATVEGLGAKIDQKLRQLKVPPEDRKIVQQEIFDEVVAPAVGSRLR